MITMNFLVGQAGRPATTTRPGARWRSLAASTTGGIIDRTGPVPATA
jgi:hypothetical protein